MPEETFYEFDNFRLSPLRRSLLHGEQSRPLTPTAFDLLLVFVQNHGRMLSKTELIKRVWAEAIVTDNNFNVTLNAVRRALGESGRRPRYILKVPGGYRFVADVREESEPKAQRPKSNVEEQPLDVGQVAREESGQDVRAPGRSSPSVHLGHVLISCALYATLYAVSLFLEVAYEFDRFEGMAWKIAPLVFGWMMISSVVGLASDRKLTSRNRASGVLASTAIFFMAVALLFGFLTRYLPSFPITESTLQAYPAQAAYLKNTSYFLVLGLIYMILPFHFIVAVEREIQRGHHRQVLGLLIGDKLSAAPRGTIYPRFWALASLLVVLAVFSLVMTSHLLDHLKPGPYMNLFTQLVYLRGILYFALGIECLIWYYRAIDEIKRECLVSVPTN
ncbi:MAG: winged helix-turn-helix domain-containing protein [Pyrinomonadaceae bacterium]